MVQTQIEEKMEMFKQEIHGIKKEISKLPAKERTLNELAKNMERQNQMMLQIMESAAQDRSTMSEKINRVIQAEFSDERCRRQRRIFKLRE